LHRGRKPINANNLSAIVYKRGIPLRFERDLKRFNLSYIHTQHTVNTSLFGIYRLATYMR